MFLPAGGSWLFFISPSRWIGKEQLFKAGLMCYLPKLKKGMVSFFEQVSISDLISLQRYKTKCINLMIWYKYRFLKFYRSLSPYLVLNQLTQGQLWASDCYFSDLKVTRSLIMGLGLTAQPSLAHWRNYNRELLNPNVLISPCEK